MSYQGSNNHSVSRLTAHLIWAIGYGCWSSGNITDKMINEYLEHHRKNDKNDGSDFILE